MSQSKRREILTMLTKIEEITPDKVEENASFLSTLTKFQNCLEFLKENWLAAALWVQ